MHVTRLAVGVLTGAVALGSGQTASAQSADSAVGLVVAAGRPLRVALDKRIRITGIGQPVSGTVLEPVYAYDRIVVPAGTKVLGHVAHLEPASRKTRLGSMVRGDFTPLRYASREFKLYAPGVGLVKEGSLELVSHKYVQ